MTYCTVICDQFGAKIHKSRVQLIGATQYSSSSPHNSQITPHKYSNSLIRSESIISQGLRFVRAGNWKKGLWIRGCSVCLTYLHAYEYIYREIFLRLSRKLSYCVSRTRAYNERSLMRHLNFIWLSIYVRHTHDFREISREKDFIIRGIHETFPLFSRKTSTRDEKKKTCSSLYPFTRYNLPGLFLSFPFACINACADRCIVSRVICFFFFFLSISSLERPNRVYIYVICMRYAFRARRKSSNRAAPPEI